MPTSVSSQPRQELDNLLEEAGDVVFRLNQIGQLLFASQRAIARIGGSAPLAGSALAKLVADGDQAALAAALAEVSESRAPKLVEVRIKTVDIEIWHELRISAYNNANGALELLVVGRDMTMQHATEERLRHMATHDGLTELPNRLLLSDRMRMVIANARRSGQGFSVATVGLDGFKKVNDGLGHPIGDAMLRMAAQRLRKTLRDSDTLARVGGDEFVAILPGTATEAQIKLVTGRLIATLQSPFEIENHTIYVGASVGVSVYPQHAEDEIRLLALADAAMSRAKETGKARAVVYNPSLAGPPQHDISLEAAMFQAVREGEFQLYYQPIVDAQTREIQGFETLMRWKHPTLGMVPPARFIPIAETNGLINLLGAWALKAACVQLKQFEEVAKRSLYISVNISPRQFRNDKFLDVLDDAIAFSGLLGEQLVLEITEGTLMIDPVHAESILSKMAERNARIAIDDFGTGYSSLAYLKRFPISVLKIDRTFIRDLPGSQKDGAICNAVLDLAKHLNLSVVAEGVETEEQLLYLEQRGCQYIQGYLTGKPMPANVALAALKESIHANVVPAELRQVAQ
ncbi:diguanylate cyclase (GGDEF) domain-containing protein [Duganella sp. CF402]|uniref:putative bifunctional diguanylate cyclase/phosphodiesterase n=1 Tax=unclassified Duganella TaxID=2636909 RepID=UPI0008D7F56A|nr:MULTISPECIES: bifunctional diguanylate cyclase/phosphodiesterase [unclassified Duganella]RZT10665.1 diguanylate cyclase/phosphodiesterase [Duganella sp. BK701]SEL03181.1 diguanylate cyclase (GGDEF) domain-containing protein [Duganella sp. CF402]